MTGAVRAKFADGYVYAVGEMSTEEVEAAAQRDDPIWTGRSEPIQLSDVPPEAFSARLTSRGIRIWYQQEPAR